MVAVLDTVVEHGTIPGSTIVLPGLEVTLFPVFARERQQGDVASALDGGSYFTLVFSACAGLAAGADLAIICDISLEKFYLFIVYTQFFI